MPDSPLAHREATLLEVLERVLDKGVVAAGDLTISVAGVDLIYLDLRLLLSSVMTMQEIRRPTHSSVGCGVPQPSAPVQRPRSTLHSALSTPHS